MKGDRSEVYCLLGRYLIRFIRRKQTKKETMSYPICSVVAVFKRLIRILNTLRSRIWDMTLFLFSVCWLHVNEFNSFGKIEGERSDVYYLLERYTIQKRKMIYCDNIMINLSCTVIACSIILSSVKLEKRFRMELRKRWLVYWRILCTRTIGKI